MDLQSAALKFRIPMKTQTQTWNSELHTMRGGRRCVWHDTGLRTSTTMHTKSINIDRHHHRQSEVCNAITCSRIQRHMMCCVYVFACVVCRRRVRSAVVVEVSGAAEVHGHFDFEKISSEFRPSFLVRLSIPFWPRKKFASIPPCFPEIRVHVRVHFGPYPFWLRVRGEESSC